jgi:hypothetical protein
MSQKLNRYLSVQRAKGQAPDPLQLARMLREDVSTQPTQVTGKDTVAGPGEAAEVIAEKRKALVSPPGDISPLGESPIGEGVSGDPEGIPGLNEALGGQMGLSTAIGFGVKGAAKGAVGTLAANQMGVPLSNAASLSFSSSFTSPVSAAVTLAKLGMSSVNAGIIGHSISQAFGEEAAQEAANVMSGRASLESISQQGQNAYANAKVAAEMAPKNSIQFTAPPITSTVTPHHTNKAITAAFAPSGTDNGIAIDANLEAQHGLATEAANIDMGIAESMNSGNYGGTGVGGDSGGGIGGGGGDSGIGPGNR